MIKNVSLIAIALGLLMIAAGVAAGRWGKSDFDAAEEVIVMRNIAHRVLLYIGDSTSPIVPVKRVSANEFQIPFAQSFSFQPDSLVRIIDKAVADGNLPSKYIVNVMEQQTNKLIYGYAVLGEQKSIVPCVGRTQPELPYYIDIRFQGGKAYPVKSMCVGGLGALAIGLLMLGANAYAKKKDVAITDLIDTDMEDNEVYEPQTANMEKEGIVIGKYLFSPDERLLRYNDEKVMLTAKESKILSIFAEAPNQVIDRQRLQKEIWEDEGVIVGRSLDMFISRLRKKLENDPDIKLVNIHGKGYRLKIAM